MRGLAWPNRLTHQELMPSRYSLPCVSTSQGPRPWLTGISGTVSWCCICVQGCQTLRRLRATQSSVVLVVFNSVPDYLDGARILSHMRKTPNFVSGMGALSAADRPSASTRRVSAGSMMPSSHRRAVA